MLNPHPRKAPRGRPQLPEGRMDAQPISVGVSMKSLLLAALCSIAVPCLADQQFDLPPQAVDDPAALAKAMPSLAEAIIPVYQDADRKTYLDNLFRLQLVAGRYSDAVQSLAELHALRRDLTQSQATAADLQYDIYAKAKAAQGKGSFDDALRKAFRETVIKLDDRSAALLMRALNIESAANGSLVLGPMQRAVSDALRGQQGKQGIGLGDGLRLVHAYQVQQAYQALAVPALASLINDDDNRRYDITHNMPVKTPDGATVCVLLVRPRVGEQKLPTLMEFTVYADPGANMTEARRTASNGYVGVEALSRGKGGCSQDPVAPFEHDGSDADAVIAWIIKHGWSDGRVGMFGGSYDGFTQWAAAKHLPKALKAMMPSVTAAPGIDTPMEGGAHQTFSYYWPLYTAGTGLDAALMDDYGRWNKLQLDWYKSGRAYRDLPSIDGTPNPLWQRWLDHPDYDAYWQAMIPYQKEFAAIDIPVLTTTGYYDGGQIGALYYYQEHYKYRPKAEHYLLIGPYDHIRGQRGTVGLLGESRDSLRGYDYDPAAHIDLGALRYQWFDYVFKKGKKPALLKDRVNYEVMGGDTWRHAPSLAAMAQTRGKFHFGAKQADGSYALSAAPSKTVITQTLDLTDRSDALRQAAGGSILDKDLDTWNSLEFVSQPFSKGFDLSGLFKGHLDFVANKKDFDLWVALYELTPDGRYFELNYYLQRMSYLQDRSHRHLLTPDKRTVLDFQNSRLTSRRFQPGSRLVVLVGLLRQPNIEIDYGSGKAVADETIADAGAPLQIQWSGDSYIDIPEHH